MSPSEAKTPKRPWPRRVAGFLWFTVVFARELVVANIEVAKIVLFRPVKSLSPDFITYRTTGLSEFEIVMLSHCITLTPGTTSVEISEDLTTLTVHALDASNPDAVCAGIKNNLERPILAWTR